MSRDLSDVLHGFVEDQTRASAAETCDPAQRVRTVTALAQRRRARHLSGTTAAAAAVIVAGAVVANALTAAPPPAVPVPTASVAPTPAPTSPTPAPTGSPTTAPTAPPRASAVPERTAPWVRGFVDPFETAPSVLWTVAAADVVQDWDQQVPPTFGHLRRNAVQPGVEVVDAGSTVVALVGDVYLLRREVVGLDAATGAVRWVRPDADPRPVVACAGLASDGLVVCHGLSAPEGDPELQLLDPDSGELVRAFPVEHRVDSMALVGSTAVLHGSAGTGATDVVWEGVDVRTGEVLWSHLAPGRGSPYEVTGDPVADTVVSWPYARLDGYFATVVIDVRTGAEVTGPVSPVPTGLEVEVWAPTDPETVPVLDPWARDESGAPVIGRPGSLRALDPRDGTVLWTQEGEGAIPTAVVGDLLVVRADDTTTAGLDVATGQVRWTAPVTGDAVATDGVHLLLDSGAVLLLADGTVLADGSALADGTGLADGGPRVGRPPLGRDGRLASDTFDALTLYGW